MDQRTPPTADVSPDASAVRPTYLSRLKRSPIIETLQYRDFRWVWLGMFASFMGFNMTMIARGWLVLRLADDSPLALALVMLSFAAPMTLVSLIAGAMADRLPRKQMVMASEGGNALMALALATLDITGLVAFWHLLILGFAAGSLMAFNMPTRQAMISDVVPESKLMNAVALNSSSMNLTRVIGPAAAGFLILYMGTAGVFYLIAGAHVFSLVSMGMIRAGGTPAVGPRRGVTGDIREGFAYAAGNPTLLGLVIIMFIPALFGYSYFALLPAWGREALDVGPDELGLLMMVMGVGALVGTLVLASLRSIGRRGTFLLVCGVAWGVSLAIFSQSTSYALAIPFLLLVGLLSSVFMSVIMTMMQLHSAPEMRGRIMSIGMMTFGLIPLSAVPFGAIAEGIGTPAALLLSGLLLAAFTLVFAVRYPSFRRIP